MRHGTGVLKSENGKLQRVVYQKGKFKELYKEDYSIHWKSNVEGTFDIRAKDCTEAMGIFKSLSQEEILKESSLNINMNKLKVTDMTVYVEDRVI